MSKTLGFAPKQRTKEEINQEYNQQAALYGHEQCMVAEATEHVDRFLTSLQERLKKMLELRQEAAKLAAHEAKAEASLAIQPEGPASA